ncbi:MAG: hypothetical protein ACWA5R_14025 [bacterium]
MRWFWFLCLFSAGIVHAQIVVVVSKDSDISSLDKQDVSNIFLSRTKRFPNGERVYPLETSEEGLRLQFYHGISGRSISQLNAYWASLVFTGKGKPPKEVKDVDKLISELLERPGGIAFIRETQLTDDMRIVYQLP